MPASAARTAEDVARRHHEDPFRDFNTALKLALRMFRARLAPMEAQLSFMLVGYKMMKTVNKRWPYRYFAESIAAPYAASMLARDEAFFLDPARFSVPGYEAVCDGLRAGWSALTEDDKRAVWDACAVLLAKGDACSRVKARGE